MSIIDMDLFPRRSPRFSEHSTLQLIHSTVPPNQSLTAISVGSFQSSASGCAVALAELSPGASRHRTCMSQGGVSPSPASPLGARSIMLNTGEAESNVVRAHVCRACTVHNKVTARVHGADKKIADAATPYGRFYFLSQSRVERWNGHQFSFIFHFSILSRIPFTWCTE